MEGWSKGRKVTIAGVEVSDDGLVLRRSRFLKEDETRFFTWFEVSKGAHNGFLNFYGKPDKKFTTSFSYKDDWNVHIFDFRSEEHTSELQSLMRISSAVFCLKKKKQINIKKKYREWTYNRAQHTQKINTLKYRIITSKI